MSLHDEAVALAEKLYKGPCERPIKLVASLVVDLAKERCLSPDKVRKAGGLGRMNHRKMCDSCAAYWLVCQAALLLKDIALKERGDIVKRAKIREISCGCCSGGCVCQIHADERSGFAHHKQQTCSTHAAIALKEKAT